MFGESINSTEGEIKVSFGYQCNGKNSTFEDSDGYQIFPRLRRSSRSFSCLSGAALSANATLANTNICNGIIGSEILPSWDSPNSFRRIPSSPSLSSKVDILSSSLQSTLSNLSFSPSTPGISPETDSYLKPMSAHSPSEGFLNAMEVQVAGGAAGEDRVQAVCSEEDGWLFCGIYDGFNGRDAADFLAGTLYDTFLMNFNLFNWDMKDDVAGLSHCSSSDDSFQCVLDGGHVSGSGRRYGAKKYDDFGGVNYQSIEVDRSSDLFKQGVLECLQRALSQAENDFLCMVEQEMEDRPDLVSVGSCVLVALLVGKDLYTLNLGDSRVVLATHCSGCNVGETELKAIQLSDIHSTDNEAERSQLLANHPHDQSIISFGKVKGKLKVTRAFGVGYLKKVSVDFLLLKLWLLKCFFVCYVG